jgi:glutaredoxin 3
VVKDITIYSTATCGFCFALKKYLKDRGIEYNEKHVDQDMNAAKEMFEKSHQMGVPFTIFTKEDGTEVNVLGFDIPKIQAVLK